MRRNRRTFIVAKITIAAMIPTPQKCPPTYLHFTTNTNIPDNPRVPKDPGVPEDPGLVKDPGATKDPGSIKDLGVVADPGAPVNPGIIADLGVPADPGVAVDLRTILNPATSIMGKIVLVGNQPPNISDFNVSKIPKRNQSVKVGLFITLY